MKCYFLLQLFLNILPRVEFVHISYNRLCRIHLLKKRKRNTVRYRKFLTRVNFKITFLIKRWKSLQTIGKELPVERLLETFGQLNQVYQVYAIAKLDFGAQFL